MNQKFNKGITLIALVITIIVLLILAGVTISMVLGDDGIIAQAQASKEANEDASLKDAVEIAKGEAAIAGHNKQQGLDKSKLSTAIQTNMNNAGEYTYENTVSRMVDGVPIPVGFAYVEGTKVDTGLIVVDEYGNEFVWVPVDEVKESGSVNYTDNEVWLVNDDSDKSDTPQKDEVPTGVATDYEAMKTSVKIYGGFYVGRYETSWTGTKVASIGNVTSMSGATIVGESGANWYTFYTEQKKLHENSSSSVVSGMIYGSQWNAIMDWMSEEVNPYAVDKETTDKYIFDSTGMGHYCMEPLGSEIAPVEPIKTGSNSAYSVKNIYDLAGNYIEWTIRADLDWGMREDRGGYFGESGFNTPAENYCALRHT